MKTKCYRKLLETAFTVNLLPVSLVKKDLSMDVALTLRILEKAFEKQFLNPFLAQCLISIPPEKVRKLLIFWGFQGVIEMEHCLK